jgi:argininosuccinate lyase
MKLWKGRFRKPLNPEALRFSSSLGVDQKLWPEDIAGSLAHVAMLARQRIISAGEASRIRRGLRMVGREIGAGRLPVDSRGDGRFKAEDVHMAIEARLIKNIGRVGAKLHTARSRNDQIALDERLYLMRTIRQIRTRLQDLQRSLVRQARRYQTVIMPGYTHLQRGQPILLAHHLLAYVSMLERDAGRFTDCQRRAKESPLGAGALAGTSFPVDRAAVARSLGFRGVIENSIDAVSDRDALLEFLSAGAITMMHLSRLAEELVLWSSSEWGFVEIGDDFTTGSSIMPQKKNPDIAELVRGKTGRVYGDLVALLTVMKGLPLAYNRDMQEDKEPLFDAAGTVEDSLRITALMLRTARFSRRRFEGELNSDFLLATELADYLTRKGLPFREAHAVVGSVVDACRVARCSLSDLPLREYRKYSPRFGKDLFDLLNVKTSLRMKVSSGSTAPREVSRALGRWEKKLGL